MHTLLSQDQETEIAKFPVFDRDKLKSRIIEHLSSSPNDVLEHWKNDDLLNFYCSKNGKPSLIILKGNKEFYRKLR